MNAATHNEYATARAASKSDIVSLPIVFLIDLPSVFIKGLRLQLLAFCHFLAPQQG
jgi:hypothetical protein